jgi:hypothetical protein
MIDFLYLVVDLGSKVGPAGPATHLKVPLVDDAFLHGCIFYNSVDDMFSLSPNKGGYEQSVDNVSPSIISPDPF